MKTRGLFHTLTTACLLLVVPYSTKCDKGDGKSPDKNHTHDPKTGVTNIIDVPNGTLSSVKSNASVSLGAKNSTVSNTSKSPELLVSSREGVLTEVQSTQSLRKVESSSGKPSLQPPVSQEPLKVLSNAEDATKKQNKTGEHSVKKGAFTWMEGGGLPAHKPTVSASSEHPKSSSQVPGEDMKSTSMKPDKHIAARKGAGLPPDMPSGLPPAHVEHPAHNHTHSSQSTESTSPSTTHSRKHKPKFTMVQGDKFTLGSESIIESPTTGRDYVFPLVLLIFAVPGTVFLIRFLYKRGTEFTERQQYHRMYLIDDATPRRQRRKHQTAVSQDGVVETPGTSSALIRVSIDIRTQQGPGVRMRVYAVDQGRNL